MKVLINLASGQTAMNYTAQKTVNPDRHILLTTKQTEKEAAAFLTVFPNCDDNIKVEPYDFKNIYDAVSKIIAERFDDELILNFTGGTKIQSVAAFSAFREHRKKLLYVDTENYSILTSDDGEIFSKQRINIKGKIDDIFHLNSQTARYSKVPKNKFYQTTKELLRSNDSLIQLVNKAAYKEKNFYNDIVILHIQEGNLAGTLLEVNNKKTRFIVVHKGTTLLDHTEEGLDYLKFITGGWFEVLCFEHLQSLNFFDELKMNVVVNFKAKKIEGESKNEFDIVAIQGADVIAFECKSGRVPSEAANKLLTIKNNYLSKFTPGIFLTRNPIRDPKIIERLEEYKLKSFTLNELTVPALQKILRRPAL